MEKVQEVHEKEAVEQSVAKCDGEASHVTRAKRWW